VVMILIGNYYGGVQLESFFFSGETIILLRVIISSLSPSKKKLRFKSPGQLNFVRRPVIWPGPQHGTSFMSPLLAPRIFKWIPEFRKICGNLKYDCFFPHPFRTFVHFYAVTLKLYDLSS
jgi:hypothetical protein